MAALPGAQVETLRELQEYFRWIDGHRIDGEALPDAPHKKFVPYPDLEAYFTEEANTRLRALVNHLCPSPNHSPSHITEQIVQNKYIIGFAILLMIGEGHHIVTCLKDDALSDTQLPFDQRPSTFPYSSQSDIFKNFRKQQWMFVPANLEAREKTIQAERILPITNQTEIGSGGSAKVFKAEIHPYYNRLHRGEKTVSPRELPLEAIAHPSRSRLNADNLKAARRTDSTSSRPIARCSCEHTMTRNVLLDICETRDTPTSRPSSGSMALSNVLGLTRDSPLVSFSNMQIVAT